MAHVELQPVTPRHPGDVRLQRGVAVRVRDARVAPERTMATFLIGLASLARGLAFASALGGDLDVVVTCVACLRATCAWPLASPCQTPSGMCVLPEPRS